MGCLLCANWLGAFQAPLPRAEVGLETNRFSIALQYQACDPVLPICLEGSTAYPGTSFASWVARTVLSTNGIVAWTVESVGPLSSYDLEIGTAVPDPVRGGFEERRHLLAGSSLSYWEVDGLTIADGVVAWTGRTRGPVSSWESEVGYATYDAARGRWVEGAHRYGGTALNHSVATELTVGDGMVVWQVVRNGDFAEPNNEVGYAVFDPERHLWVEGRRLYEGSLNEKWTVSGLVIAGQSIQWTAGKGEELVLETRGYNQSAGVWAVGTNALFAEFFVSTNPSPSLTGIWFTDMSLGATDWSWDFGDGLGSSVRSPRHIFADAGIYDVVLTASGPMGTNVATRTITVEPNEETLGFSSVMPGGDAIRVVLAGASTSGPVFILGSSNLTDWVPVTTLEPGLFEFSDVVQSNRPAWFYRGVSLGSGP